VVKRVQPQSSHSPATVQPGGGDVRRPRGVDDPDEHDPHEHDPDEHDPDDHDTVLADLRRELGPVSGSVEV
jgi:hypothetical protein